MVLRNDQDLQILESKLAQLKIEYTPFVIATFRQLLEEIMLPKIRNRMGTLGFSQSIIDKVRVKQQAIREKHTIRFYIVSDYHSKNGFPVADIMENGRRAYFVRPRYKKALRFFIKGVKKFSKLNKIPLLRAYKILYNTVRQYERQVKYQFKIKQNEWMREHLRS